MPEVFDTLQVGRWTLPQRFVMAPMTRSRAGEGMAPNDRNADYYAQRAGAGLIITEGTQPSLVGQGYPNTPGLFTDEQTAGWQKIATAVHANGGVIFVQLMHVGRVAYSGNKENAETVAPSEVQARGKIFTMAGRVPHDVPRALRVDELPDVAKEFCDSAARAVEAGLDGVEIHGANGYLLHQFLSPNSNLREDEYGGSPANRARFVVEVAQRVAATIGADRVGLRLSPGQIINGIEESDPDDVVETYREVIAGIAPLGLAYISIVGVPESDLFQDLRRRFGGVVIANDGFAEVTDQKRVAQIVGADLAEAVAVGRLYISNPDLDVRWRTGAELAEFDPATFYSGGDQGYADYPPLDHEASA